MLVSAAAFPCGVARKAQTAAMVVLLYGDLMARWSAVESHLSVDTLSPGKSPTAGACFLGKLRS